MNYKCRDCTHEEFEQIVNTLRSGFMYHGQKVKSKERIADALVLEANLGIRIGDVLKLRLADFVRDGKDFRINIIEQKTGKKRNFIVPNEVISFINEYCIKWGISREQKLFPFHVRNVQKYLHMVCEILELQKVSTHSMRKFFSTKAYKKNGNDIRLVQKLLQHSSVLVTQNYIGIDTERIDIAIQNNVDLV